MKNLTPYKSNILFVFLFIILQSCNETTIVKEQPQQVAKDSIKSWIKASRKKNYSLNQKKQYLQKAYIVLKAKKDDNSKTKNLSIVAYRYYELKDTLLFQKINAETQALAYQLKDSFTIADTHWSSADYFNHKQIYNKSFFHYNTAYNYFNGIQKEYQSARMLFAMAFIKGRFRDYSSSEILTFKAIEKFKKLKNYKYLYISYNHLGTIQNDIGEYDNAIFYHNKALDYLDDFKYSKKYYEDVYNNIGFAYHKKKKYKKAINYFNKALDSIILRKNFAIIISNKAYSKLKIKDTLNVKKDLLESLRIRDSLKNKAGIVTSKIHLSDYYKYKKDTSYAIRYANEAKFLAKKVKNGGEYLKTLKQLSELEPKKSKQYLDRYIQFNDSLVNAERKVQEKFTKIAFQTDEYIEETKRLSQQTIIISITGVGLILVLSLLYFLRIQKSKNEKLLLETEQQKANEQVYLLTLEQQAIIEEERAQERNRISEELHDGVLGRLFGTRVGLGFLDLNASDETEKQHESFLEELQDIEKEIRDVSHKLNNNFKDAEVNFMTLIHQLFKTNSVIGNFEHEITTDKQISWNAINQIVKINVYRIVQEALQNINKYAKPKNVTLDISIEKENLIIHLKDDGNGFDIKKVTKGIGIKNMKSRVQKLKGTLEIQSELKQGTSICIKIPIENES